MQLHGIVQSLKTIASQDPMAAALGDAGLASVDLHYGTRASRTALRPFALLMVHEVERVKNSSGVALVAYEVSVQVFVDQRVNVAGDILATFHKYWDRIASLPTLDADVARLVLIHSGDTEIGEAAEEDFGKDVVLGTTTWTIKISEHQPELQE